MLPKFLLYIREFVLKLLSLTMAEPHQEKQVLDKHDIFEAAIIVGKKHFKLGPHCPEYVEQERLLEVGEDSQVIDHSCEKMKELSMQERCNHLCELWCPTEILKKCEDVASNMVRCEEEVENNFFDKKWLEQVVKRCFSFLGKIKKFVII